MGGPLRFWHQKKQGYGKFALCVLFAQPWTPWGHGRQSRRGCVILFCLQNTRNYATWCFIFGDFGYPGVPTGTHAFPEGWMQVDPFEKAAKLQGLEHGWRARQGLGHMGMLDFDTFMHRPVPPERNLCLLWLAAVSAGNVGKFV